MEPKIGDKVRATMNWKDWFTGVYVQESDTLVQYGVKCDDIPNGVRFFTYAEKLPEVDMYKVDMTQQFEDRDGFLHWFLIASLAGIKVEGAVTEVPRIVTMQLNGVEVNPEAAIKRLEEQFDMLVVEKANELFEELKQDILKPFEDKVEEMTEVVKSLVAAKISKA